jgi:aspartate carbamoyltransferase catalytic subunit
MNHLISINDLSQKNIKSIFKKASSIEALNPKKKAKILQGKTIVNLFFENSTRTLISFELAAKNLGAKVITVDLQKSSTQKGETLKDTIKTIEAMGVDAFIIRHSENNIINEVAGYVNPNTKIINAGDGNNQHPSQALLDLYTILEHKKEIKSLKVSIIGDIKHSRVANSLIDILTKAGNSNIHIYGPKTLLPNNINYVNVSDTLNQALENADVVVMLRIQKERIESLCDIDFNNYHRDYGIDRDKIKLCKPDCIIMHPGPFNREIEISSDLADNPPSLILQQVKNGVIIRQSILANLLK